MRCSYVRYDIKHTTSGYVNYNESLVKIQSNTLVKQRFYNRAKKSNSCDIWTYKQILVSALKRFPT